MGRLTTVMIYTSVNYDSYQPETLYTHPSEVQQDGLGIQWAFGIIPLWGDGRVMPQIAVMMKKHCCDINGMVEEALYKISSSSSSSGNSCDGPFLVPKTRYIAVDKWKKPAYRTSWLYICDAQTSNTVKEVIFMGSFFQCEVGME